MPTPAAPSSGRTRTTVRVVEELGADAYLYATPVAAAAPTPGQASTANLEHQIVVRIPGRLRLARGEIVHLVAAPARTALFDAVSGERLSA